MDSAVQTRPATPPDPFIPPVSPNIKAVPPAPAVTDAPPRATDADLRAREAILDQREAELNRRVAKRVAAATLTDKTVESQIVSEYAICAFDAFKDQPNIAPDAERALRCVTIVVLVLRNGFCVTGSSACAAPENYDADRERKEAKADAMAKLWLVSEYAARNQLMGIDGPAELVE